MLDREKVIKALENCVRNGVCINCEYDEHVACKTCLMADVLALLKEQEDMGKELTDAMELIHKKNERIEKLLKEQKAVKPIQFKDIIYSDGAYKCGNCTLRTLDKDIDFYCPSCGRAVKWE